MSIASSRSWLKRHPLQMGVLILVIIVGGIATLELTNTTYFFHERPTPMTASPATKGEHFTEDELNKPDAGKGGDETDTNNSESGSDNSVVLEKPTGVFVSNHHPNLSGSPAPNQIQSVCTTTSGAMCTIVFTKGDTTKSLPSQMTDSGGSTYWTWKLQDIGLTEGTWQIQARATLGNKTTSANDLMDLVIAP